MAKRGWRTVVRDGDPTAAKSMSSKPTTDRSPGTDTPAAAKAWMAPIAISSLAAKTAVGAMRPGHYVGRRRLAGADRPVARSRAQQVAAALASAFGEAFRPQRREGVRRRARDVAEPAVAEVGQQMRDVAPRGPVVDAYEGDRGVVDALAERHHRRPHQPRPRRGARARKAAGRRSRSCRRPCRRRVARRRRQPASRPSRCRRSAARGRLRARPPRCPSARARKTGCRCRAAARAACRQIVCAATAR